MTILHVYYQPQQTDTMAELVLYQTAHSKVLCSMLLAYLHIQTAVL